MTCEQYGLYLSKYVDDELTLEERKTVEDHLATCSECRQLLAQFFHNDEVLSNALAGEIFGNQMIRSIMTQIRQDQGIAFGLRRFGRRTWNALTSPKIRYWWAAAAVFLITVGLIVAGPLKDYLSTLTRPGPDSVDLKKLQEKHVETIAELRSYIDRQHLDYMDRLLRKMPVQNQNIMAYVPPSIEKPRIYVRAEFDSKHLIKSYSIYRREKDKDEVWPMEPLKASLFIPEYWDDDIRAGITYEYRFEAVPLGEFSYPITQMVPELSADAIEIELANTIEHEKRASFLITKLINGRTSSHFDWFSLNEPVGGYSHLTGIDSSTGYTLVGMGRGIYRIETKTLIPKIIDGKRYRDDQGRVEMVEQPEVWTVGPNDYADLKGPDGKILRIFCGESKRLPGTNNR